MEEKEDISDFKDGFLEIGDTIVDLYQIEGVSLKKDNHVVYTVRIFIIEIIQKSF